MCCFILHLWDPSPWWLFYKIGTWLIPRGAYPSLSLFLGAQNHVTDRHLRLAQGRICVCAIVRSPKMAATAAELLCAGACSPPPPHASRVVDLVFAGLCVCSPPELQTHPVQLAVFGRPHGGLGTSPLPKVPQGIRWKMSRHGREGIRPCLYRGEESLGPHCGVQVLLPPFHTVLAEQQLVPQSAALGSTQNPNGVEAGVCCKPPPEQHGCYPLTAVLLCSYCYGGVEVHCCVPSGCHHHS